MVVLEEVSINLVAESVLYVSDFIGGKSLLGDLLAGKIQELEWLCVWQPHRYILLASLDVQRTCRSRRFGKWCYGLSFDAYNQ